jgi:hypothetical protein
MGSRNFGKQQKLCARVVEQGWIHAAAGDATADATAAIAAA